MKKFFSILLVFSLLQVGLAYAADTGTATLENRDYIFGLSKQSEVNLNQVLFLLAGKDGTPGAAGRDGIPGIDGLDGKDGKDGVDGKNGLDGKNGIDGINGVNGINGINGAPGAPGAQGPAGPAGPAGRDGRNGVGGSDTSTSTYGAGAAQVSSCTESATVSLKAKYTGEDFVFDNVKISDVNKDCGSGSTARDIAFYFKIGASALHNSSSPKYTNGDVLKCVSPVPSSGGGTGTYQFTIANSDAVCTNFTVPSRGNFSLNDIYTADFTNRIGFEIYDH
jgi:hypothetical protein